MIIKKFAVSEFTSPLVSLSSLTVNFLKHG